MIGSALSPNGWIKNHPTDSVIKGGINAFTTGVEEPILVLSESVLSLRPREQEFIIGHELGHILFEQHAFFS